MFPFNWYPQRVGIFYVGKANVLQILVSIQLVSPASGDWEVVFKPLREQNESFHSIGIPSEWGWWEDKMLID